MASSKTPGVYIEEISVLPPSVAEVATAIPAFIGYTEKGGTAPVRITNLLEYEQTFGGASSSTFEATRSSAATTADAFVKVDRTAPAKEKNYLLYYSLSLYFRNGGGPCWIIPVGDYNKAKAAADFKKGIEAVEALDEPTLIMLTDAITVGTNDYYDLCVEALKQCNLLKDRFVILDVLPNDIAPAAGATAQTDAERFRDKVASENLRYGAAYYPYLLTSLNYVYKEADVKITTQGETPPATSVTLGTKEIVNTPLANAIKAAINDQRVTLPPSPAIAGVYARVDRDRGVWKAPANVSVASVIGPTKRITNAEQETLNIHESGKSINAIRDFTGKGTLVWGARTLAGNDNEWRYVSVRRLFNMIEESTQKATAFAVFESNTAGTWLKVRAMIESYLYGLWERGALAGPTPESAYVVNVGLGQTMTTDDVLNGIMKVRIGIAPSRPAEFIYLIFMHKLQEA